ncbi:hypothetical protein BD779DRAFT_615986 [Infundibulicybe gibba]|nr:hypothetical protein BD779DRAFT_615986 [Infundibulicybe gibba]
MPGIPNHERHRSILKTQRPRAAGRVRSLPKTLSDKIPTEIIDIILDHLHADRQTLRACSLVCKSWLPTVRHHFPPRITIRPRNVNEFSDLLSSPYSTLATSIRRLAIQLQGDDPSSFFEPESPRAECWGSSPSSPGYTACSPLCIPLHPGVLGPMERACLTTGFPNLTELEFQRCTFLSLTEFATLLSALHNLQRLSLSDTEWLNAQLPETRQRIPPGLHTLELYLSHHRDFLTWLLSFPGGLPFETVRLGSAFWRGDDALMVNRFLRSLGPRLKHLSLSSPTYLGEVDLSFNSELRSLHISHLLIRGDTGPGFTSVDGLMDILSKLNSAHLTVLVFYLLFQNPDLSADLDWDAIGRVLSKPCFENLEP